jgi:hypothetical protein
MRFPMAMAARSPLEVALLFGVLPILAIGFMIWAMHKRR